MKKLLLILSIALLAGCNARTEPEHQLTNAELRKTLDDTFVPMRNNETPASTCVDHVWYLLFQNGVTPRYGVNGLITTC